MPGGMPYHIEKGATLTLFEQYLNGPRADMQASLDILGASEGTLDWLKPGMPPGLWEHPIWTASGAHASGDELRDDITRRWFGVTFHNGAWTEGSFRGGQWVEGPSGRTGYWIGYRGNVAEIVRRALQWALELALSTGSGETAAGGRPVWPIEIFWKCPAPWFEAWVVSRRVAPEGRGLVTVVFVTPSHEGASVSESPLAQSDVAGGWGTHPVPSFQDDYEQLGVKHPQHPGRPRVSALDREFATWVVTHENHHLADDTGPEPEAGNGDAATVFEENTAAPREFAVASIPQLAVYEGDGPIVVVAPSMAAGGVKHDGSV